MLIVSAFYNVGRGERKTQKRTTSQYIEHFKFWCGIDNEIIVYTSEEFAKDIESARAECGKENKTQIIIKSLESFDYETLNKMREIFNNYPQNRFRIRPDSIECTNPEYCFLNWCKSLFVKDAIERFELSKENRQTDLQKAAEDGILWLDFGFNHGEKLFIDKNQFNFELKPQKNIDFNKINLFSKWNLNGQNLAEIYYNMRVEFMGGLMYANANKWLEFSNNFKEAEKVYFSMQIVDTDQQLLIWCARNYPQNYISFPFIAWFDSLFYFIPENIAKNIKTKTIYYYKEVRNNAKNLKGFDKIKEYFKVLYYRQIDKKIIPFPALINNE